MERRKTVKVVSVLLVVAMLFPLALVRIAAQPVDAVEPTDAVGTVREVPLSIEVLENTRELVRVKVNDILITQEVDPNYSTKENTRAVLRFEDLNTGEVEEIQITTSYRAGLYHTTLYDSEGRVSSTFISQLDPLEPGALRQELNKESGSPIMPQNETQNKVLSSSYTFWWDGVKFVSGDKPDINYCRPCVEFYNICKFETVIIEGDRLNHKQVSVTETADIMILPVMLMGAAFAGLGATLPGGGAALGAALGIWFGHFCQSRLEAIFVDERGAMWIFFKRNGWFTIPGWVLVLGDVTVSGFYRVGSVTWWDFCPYTSQGPSVPDPLEVVIGVYCRGDFALILDNAAEVFEVLWPGTDVVITPFDPLDIETHMAHDLALGRIDLALSRTLVGESFAHYVIARGEVALIVNSRTAERLALGGAETFAISGEELRWIWERGADIVGTTWRDVDELDDRNNWCDTYDLNFVVPRARIIGSGNRAAFHHLVEYAGAVDEICADKEVATIDATGLPRLWSTGCMVMAIAANDFQIGYVPKGFIDDPEIQALKIGERLPGEDGYPMVHVLFLVSN